MAIDDRVVRDAVQPGPKGRSSQSKPGQGLPGLQEDGFGQILGLDVIRHLVVDVAIDLRQVALVKDAERR